jgi:glutaredoxin 3
VSARSLLSRASEASVSKIVMYLTQWCPYCRNAKALLARKGQKWVEIDVDAEPGRRSEMMERSGRTSVPQIWIDERHVGGYDDLAALDASGELDALLH